MERNLRPDTLARRHQALGEVSRLRLLDLLRAHPDGIGAADAAAEVGLHLATVREHLEVLVASGLARRSAERRTGRGRPRILYSPAPAADQEGAEGYRFLAEILASLVEGSMRRPSERAEAAGVEWGRSLVERARPLARLPRAEAMARLERMLDDLGFEPEVAGGPRNTRVLLHRCPFREVATQHPAVVCGAHLGIIKGALDELGVDAGGTTLEPLVTPTLCVSRVASAGR